MTKSLQKKYCETIFFLATDATLTSDNLSGC